MKSIIEFIKSILYFFVYLIFIIIIVIPSFFIILSLTNLREHTFAVPDSILYTSGDIIFFLCLLIVSSILGFGLLYFIFSHNKKEFLKSAVTENKRILIIVFVLSAIALLLFPNYRYASPTGIHRNITFGVSRDYSWNDISKVGFDWYRLRSGDIALQYLVYMKNNSQITLDIHSDEISIEEANQFLNYLRENNIPLEKYPFYKPVLDDIKWTYSGVKGGPEFIEQAAK